MEEIPLSTITKNGLKDGNAGYFSDSTELMSWCYRKGDLIGDSGSYCDPKKKAFDERLQELKNRKKKEIRNETITL
jgi:hypothetical protein